MSDRESQVETKKIDDAESEDPPAAVNEENGASKSKKKKSKPKNLAPATHHMPEVNNEENGLRCLGIWPPVEDSRQTWPPSLPVDKTYKKGFFPKGEILEYPGANGAQRMHDEEKRALEREKAIDYDALRRGAEAHRQTRKWVQSFVKPGMTTLDVVQKLEKMSGHLIHKQGLEAGYAFPTGISFNNVAAHYTPNYGEAPVVIKKDDLVKIDFGLHVGGRLVDCAFSLAFDEKFDPLIKATQDGTNTGLKEAGIDVRLGELGGAIEEVIRSYEIELDGKVYAIKPISNLNGHTVDTYRVHAGKSIPIVKCDIPDIMEEGEVYAIETFASTGKGTVYEEGICSHYMPDWDFIQEYKTYRPKDAKTKQLQQGILEHFGTLAFCRRWLDDNGMTRHLMGLKHLCDDGWLNAYPPLADIPGCYTSQMEHTVILRPTCKEIVTRGLDY